MKFHKKIHQHIKTHHKKYLLGISLGGLGLLAVKILVLGTGIFGFLNQNNLTLAAGVMPPEELLYVELNNQNIVQEPFLCDIEATACYLSNKNVIGIASGTFINHQNLTTLFLDKNEITSIEIGDFNGAINLETINLSSNPITFIMTGAFDSLPGLYSINTTNACNNKQSNIQVIRYSCSNNLYTDQASCETAGACSNNLYTGQFSCETNYTCSDILYTDQASCVNAGICRDANSNLLIEYTGQNSCINAGICYDPSWNLLTGVTNQVSCEAAGICYNSYNWNILNDYTNQASCETNYSCSDSLYTDQTSCINAGVCTDVSYTGQASCEAAGICYDPSWNVLNNYTGQVSCQAAGVCYDYNGNYEITKYTDQVSCESHYSCDNEQYTDQTSCEGAGVCYDYNGNYEIAEYTNQTSCESHYSCDNEQYTDQTSCEGAGVCYDYNGNYEIAEYTNQTSCEANYSCSDSQYTDQTSCENNSEIWDINSWSSSTWNLNSRSSDGSTWNLNSRSSDGNYWNVNSRFSYGNTWNLNYWQAIGNYWYSNSWASSGNAWNINLWSSYLNTWNGILAAQSNTDSDYCSIINSTNPANFISTLTGRGYTFGNDYYSGYTSLSFIDGITNQILVNTIMKSTNSDITKVQYDSNTAITINGQSYKGILFAPVDFSTGSIKGLNNVVSATKFGDSFNNIEFSKPVTVRIPAPGKNIGNSVKLFYSTNGLSWKFHTDATIIDVGGKPAVEFTTDHATYFAIGELIGSFTINNDDISTISQNITLNISASGSTYMRFSNDNSNRSAWENYSTSKSRTLSAGYATKTVYAEFDTDGDYTADASTFDDISYSNLLPGQTQGNITLEITGGTTECVYGTSLTMNSQDVKIGIPYTFTGIFPSTWYCQDYRGIDGGWTLTVQVGNLQNQNNNIISGSNLRISHDPVVVEGDLACTGYNGAATEFYSAPYEILEKIPDSKKICKVSADNVSLLVNVPANQAPGNYSGTLTLTMNGF